MARAAMEKLAEKLHLSKKEEHQSAGDTATNDSLPTAGYVPPAAAARPGVHALSEEKQEGTAQQAIDPAASPPSKDGALMEKIKRKSRKRKEGETSSSSSSSDDE